tara:strand:+ start:367 stop:606 length:240 start_codon:yes stop_codon:yes gene_type:complete
MGNSAAALNNSFIPPPIDNYSYISVGEKVQSTVTKPEPAGPPLTAKKEKIQALLRDLQVDDGKYKLEKQTKLKIKMLKS